MISEHVHQAALVKWFRDTYPDLLIWATPNGGKRDAREARRLKLEGALAGVPDLEIPSHRLYIEMKNEKGKVSKAQQSVIDQLKSFGCICAVCYSYKEAKELISNLIG